MVTVKLPGYLRPFADGASEVELPDATSVAALLDALFRVHPALRDRVVTEQNEVRPHVNVFVGEESIRFLDGLDTRLKSGDLVHIIPAVSGG